MSAAIQNEVERLRRVNAEYGELMRPLWEYVDQNGLAKLGEGRVAAIIRSHASLNKQLDEALERETALASMFAELKRIFGTGEAVNSTDVVLANAINSAHFAKLLHAVEQKFFTVNDDFDDDYLNDAPAPKCLVNSWGSTKSDYVNQFGRALKRRDLIKQAEALEDRANFIMQIDGYLDSFKGEVAALLRSGAEDLRQQAKELTK